MMQRRTFHFQPTLDVEELRLGAAKYFHAEPVAVFIYHDAVDILGSDTRDPDALQKAAFDEASVRILIRRYDPDTGPIEGWLSFDVKASEIDEPSLAAALATASGVAFYYVDPTPDPDDDPGENAAQIEVSPNGALRKVWLSELNDAEGFQTILSGRGEDEDDEE